MRYGYTWEVELALICQPRKFKLIIAYFKHYTEKWTLPCVFSEYFLHIVFLRSYIFVLWKENPETRASRAAYGKLTNLPFWPPPPNVDREKSASGHAVTVRETLAVYATEMHGATAFEVSGNFLECHFLFIISGSFSHFEFLPNLEIVILVLPNWYFDAYNLWCYDLAYILLSI